MESEHDEAGELLEVIATITHNDAAAGSLYHLEGDV